MKSTYKILSKNLDGLPLTENIPIKVWTSNEKYLPYITNKTDLFDFPHCRRVIKASDLLSTNLDSLSAWLTQLDNLEELIIKIDFISSIPATNALFVRRINQIITQLMLYHHNVREFPKFG